MEEDLSERSFDTSLVSRFPFLWNRNGDISRNTERPDVID